MAPLIFYNMLSGNLASQARHELVSPQKTIASRNVVRELAGIGAGCDEFSVSSAQFSDPS
jgi:hypothetical protein